MSGFINAKLNLEKSHPITGATQEVIDKKFKVQ